MTRARSFGPAVVAPALRCALSCSAVRAASEDETQQGRFDRLGVLAAGRISCAIFFFFPKPHQTCLNFRLKYDKLSKSRSPNPFPRPLIKCNKLDRTWSLEIQLNQSHTVVTVNSLLTTLTVVSVQALPMKGMERA